MRIQNSIHIDAPAARVWELTLAVEGWPELTPTMTAVEPLDGLPIRIGSKVRVKQPAQRSRVWTVTDLVPREKFAWTARSLGTIMTATHDLVEDESGTTNTLSIDIEGRFAPIVGALVRRPILKAITTENLGFKAAASP